MANYANKASTPSRSIKLPSWSFGALVLYTLFCSTAAAPGANAHGEIDDTDAPLNTPVAATPCIDRFAAEYPCLNIDLTQFVPVSNFGTNALNDIWGWTDPVTGFEYAILGVLNSTAFLRIDENGQAHYLGFMPPGSFASQWRDMKVYQNHAYVVSEAFGHGVQVFDLTRLRDIAVEAESTHTPMRFTHDTKYNGISAAHNIAINEATGYAYVVGDGSCRGGLHMIDIRLPKQPQFAGCFSEDGYTHDTQCVIYNGEDTRYAGREICFNANEDTLTIVDVTDKQAPLMLSRSSYPGSTYAHQGWLTEDHNHFLLNDELDELYNGSPTRTYVWSTGDLENPAFTGAHTGISNASDHNLYISGAHVFQANYRSGIRVLRLGDLAQAEMAEVAFFDTQPADNLPGFSGTWSVYPYFKSGHIIASDIRGGLYVLKPDLHAVSECSDGIDNDGDGLRDHQGDPACSSADSSSESRRDDVELLLHPYSGKRPHKLFRKRTLKVAIPGSTTVDVAQIDLDSLAVHTVIGDPHSDQHSDVDDADPVNAKKHYAIRDINKDGWPDLALKIALTKPSRATGGSLGRFHDSSHGSSGSGSHGSSPGSSPGSSLGTSADNSREATLDTMGICLSGLIAGDNFEACAITHDSGHQ